jgi:hypothetical protein
VSERHFEPAEVERLLPELTRIVTRLLAARGEATAARERLQAEQQRIGIAGGGILDQVAWRRDAERIATQGRTMEAALKEIAALGGTVKDLDLGLVDFPHLRDGRTVNLCWKYGERSVGYWHGLDEGYAARKPL